jgi:branched-chain amino acid aminotransferase
MAPARAKITGAYINSALAKSEAQMNGFDEAIMLSSDGHVAEGSAANLFLVKNGTLFTPDPTQNVLEGITRRAVLKLTADDLGLPVVERALVQSVDHRQISDGRIGPVTRALRDHYERVTLGRDAKYRSWLTPVYAGRRVVA